RRQRIDANVGPSGTPAQAAGSVVVVVDAVVVELVEVVDGEVELEVLLLDVVEGSVDAEVLVVVEEVALERDRYISGLPSVSLPVWLQVDTSATRLPSALIAAVPLLQFAPTPFPVTSVTVPFAKREMLRPKVGKQ